MTTRYYDVIVLGRSIGCLAAAALLARREFRVLVLGQGQRGPSYSFERFKLRRRSFTLLTATSPVWLRILAELGQAPTFKRRTRALDPMFAWLTPGRRMEVPPDPDLFAIEVEREFPEVRQLVDELYATFTRLNASIDAVLERDLVWPPETLWERFETGRHARALADLAGATGTDLLAKFPARHAYRDLTLLPASFAADMVSAHERMPALTVARLHGAWTRGVHALNQGEEELEAFLTERIRAHGGECRLQDRALKLVVTRGQVSGVIGDGEDEPLGTSAVVASDSGEMVAELSGGEGVTSRARQHWPHMTATEGRFIVNIVVRNRALPAPLPDESFVVPDHPSGAFDPRRPPIRLQRAAAESERDDETRLLAEVVFPTRGQLTLLEAREAAVSTLREALPFLDEHVQLIDSPHDGLPLFHYVSGTRRDIDRIHLPGGTGGAEAMEWRWAADPRGYLDVAGEPVRGPIPGTFLVGKTVLPGLGQEGELMAAWSAARLITRKDGPRQRMRRQMWSKIEGG